MRFVIIFLSLVVCLCAKSPKHKAHKHAISSPPKVVCTIAPIHSLVAAVMEGIAEPDLLISPEKSAHGYQLKPSEAAILNKAEIVVWIGPEYETTFNYTIIAAKPRAVVTATKIPGVNLLPLRTFKDQPEMCCAIELPTGCGCDHHEDHHHEISGKDGHLWLAVPNAKALVKEITKTLSELDQRHAADYLANSKAIIDKLNQLQGDITAEMKSVKGKKYLTYHDFTQYFDRSYGTECVAAVRIQADREPTAADIKRVKDHAAMGALVIFSEPQFDTKMLRKISNDSGIGYAQLDALGVGLTPGKQLYFEMMRRFMNDLKKGLEMN